MDHVLHDILLVLVSGEPGKLFSDGSLLHPRNGSLPFACFGAHGINSFILRFDPERITMTISRLRLLIRHVEEVCRCRCRGRRLVEFGSWVESRSTAGTIDVEKEWMVR